MGIGANVKVLQSFQSFYSKMHIAHCNHMSDHSIGTVESHVNSTDI